MGRMLKSRELGAYKRAIEKTLVSMKRYDVGVGSVAEKNAGTISVALSRWRRARTVEVPIDDLQGKERARVAVRRAIHDLSKAIEKETMEPRITIEYHRFKETAI